MDLPKDDRNSFNSIAGFHGYPDQNCVHHQIQFFAWHRRYNFFIEDALRTVPGCHTITLPYWDMNAYEADGRGSAPNILFEAPFDSFTNFTNQAKDTRRKFNVEKKFKDRTEDTQCPETYGLNPDKTTRVTKDIIQDKETRTQMRVLASACMKTGHWEEFGQFANGLHLSLERVHDSSHKLLSGGTTKNPHSNAFDFLPTEFSAYDPCFMIMHADFDRLWWEWQKRLSATDIESFKTTFNSPEDTNRGLAATLRGQDAQFQDMIDLSQWGVEYTPATYSADSYPLEPKGLEENAVITVQINRMLIQGAFDVAVQLPDGSHFSQCFIQAQEPLKCVGCKKQGIVMTTVTLFDVKEVPDHVAIVIYEQKEGRVWKGDIRLAPFKDSSCDMSVAKEVRRLSEGYDIYLGSNCTGGEVDISGELLQRLGIKENADGAVLFRNLSEIVKPLSDCCSGEGGMMVRRASQTEYSQPLQIFGYKRK